MKSAVVTTGMGIAATVLVLTGHAAFAQENGPLDAKGYVSAFGGAVWDAGNATGSVLFEGGARIAPHLMVFTNVGRFANLKADLQPTLDATTTTLADQGLNVAAGGALPAWYGVGGLRAELAGNKHAVPYLLGGIGAARLDPSPELSFDSGTMPDGSTPAIGSDVRTALVTAGILTAATSSTAFMAMLGGGVQLPVSPHWAVDVGYRYSHIAADSALNAGALNTNAVTFGFGYHF